MVSKIINRVRIAVVVAAALFAGCATQPEQEGFSPVTEETGDVITPGKRTSAAVLDLLERARSASKAGEIEKAEAYLERAIRIEPKNPVLWHYMAKVHLHRGRMQKAQGLAAKSNSLAGSDRRLRSDNWRIIAHARQGMGDVVGARKAEAKAEAFKN